jgi:hypothetical protein
MVIGNAVANVVDVMKTDIVEVSATGKTKPFHDNPAGVPSIASRPIEPLKLMLVVEQPDAKLRSHDQHRQLRICL